MVGRVIIEVDNSASNDSVRWQGETAGGDGRRKQREKLMMGNNWSEKTMGDIWIPCGGIYHGERQ